MSCSNEAAIKTTDMKNTVTPRQKFANYFNLKENFYVENTQINGWAEHEGQKFKFSAYFIGDVFDFDEEYLEKYKNFYTRDLNGANHWLEICISTCRGCEYEYDIDNFKSTEYDCIEEFIGYEAVHDYELPYIEEKYSAIKIKEEEIF